MYDSEFVSTESTNGTATPLVSPHAAVPHNRSMVSLSEVAAMLGVPIDVPTGMTDVEFPVRRLQPGETLCRAGDEFDALYVVRSGFLKTVSFDGTGNEQVLAFPMRGDAIGLDGFDQGHYTADAIALESCHVIIVPFARIAGLAHRIPGIERLIYSIFNRELVHRQNMVRLLGMLNAEARVAAFLLDLSERFGRLGCSKSSFVLRMTRQELGSYLGIKLETVSRALSAFAASGVMDVSRREMVLNDVEGLRRKLESPAAKDLARRTRHEGAVGSMSSSARVASRAVSWSPMAA
ncbi:MAG: helix-turn-helix domain-containing protein [Betaproteobacteria bacterium]|nr:helix-turn-helix domain-containing protein [Betaproteobacteria bacterium]